MKRIAIGLFFLGSSLAVAAGDVDAFLTAYGSMDKSGSEVMTEYRAQVQTKCTRDVSVEELKKFSNSALYFKLVALRATGASNAPEYHSGLASVSCK